MAALRSAYLPAAARVSTISLVAASSSAAVGWRVGAMLLCAWAAWPAVDPDRSTEAAQPATSPESYLVAGLEFREPKFKTADGVEGLSGDGEVRRRRTLAPGNREEGDGCGEGKL